MRGMRERTEDTTEKQLNYFVNKCDWCLMYGKGLVTHRKHFKRAMLKNGKGISINLCKSCEDKLKDILDD